MRSSDIYIPFVDVAVVGGAGDDVFARREFLVPYGVVNRSTAHIYYVGIKILDFDVDIFNIEREAELATSFCGDIFKSYARMIAGFKMEAGISKLLFLGIFISMGSGSESSAKLKLKAVLAISRIRNVNSFFIVFWGLVCCKVTH